MSLPINVLAPAAANKRWPDHNWKIVKEVALESTDSGVKPVILEADRARKSEKALYHAAKAINAAPYGVAIGDLYRLREAIDNADGKEADNDK